MIPDDACVLNTLSVRDTSIVINLLNHLILFIAEGGVVTFSGQIPRQAITNMLRNRAATIRILWMIRSHM